ncbi:MAG TPA: GyrI-like domain-containing protein [Anaerolineales bacterium]|nr:GyrI-like domain-containing protein [Anaerolineales bacterium]
MEKLDLRKQFKHLYLPSAKKVEVVDVPEFKFVLIDGAIEPGQSPGTSPAFLQAMEALYGISYTLKFMSKQRKEGPIDYTVMALEGLWWVEGGQFDITNYKNWHWTAMIMQPDHITPEMYQQALEQLRKKKPNAALDKLRFEAFHEGLCIQTMHIGPYAEEMSTIARMDDFAEENGYSMHGKHHEIYLGDSRRADPAKLKTMLRHPVRKTGE